MVLLFWPCAHSTLKCSITTHFLITSNSFHVCLFGGLGSFVFGHVPLFKSLAVLTKFLIMAQKLLHYLEQ